MNRAMTSHETYTDGDEQPSGLLVMQCRSRDLPEKQFWVARGEAPDLIRMLATAFDIDLERLA